MSIHVLSHVMKHSEAQLGARLVLFVLAEHAHDDGSESYPSVSTIVERSRLSRRSVQSALRRLEKDGDIKRMGVGSAGQTKWRVALRPGAETAPPVRGAESARGEVDDTGGRNLRHEGSVAASPEPTTNPPENRSEKNARARDDEKQGKVQLPEGFPEEMRPHLVSVFRVLRDFAARHAIKEVNPVSLAQLIMANQRKPLVAAAYNCAAHWESSNTKDIVARYRNWLPKTDTLAAAERLDKAGMPSDAPSDLPAGVARIGGRGAPAGAKPTSNTGDLDRFDGRGA